MLAELKVCGLTDALLEGQLRPFVAEVSKSLRQVFKGEVRSCLDDCCNELDALDTHLNAFFIEAKLQQVVEGLVEVGVALILCNVGIDLH